MAPWQKQFWRLICFLSVLYDVLMATGEEVVSSPRATMTRTDKRADKDVAGSRLLISRYILFNSPVDHLAVSEHSGRLSSTFPLYFEGGSEICLAIFGDEYTHPRD